MLHLRSIEFNFKNHKNNEYPYQVPVIKNTKEIKFTQPVTIFVGENGTGKSTILESITSSANLITIEGSNKENAFSEEMLKQIKLTWSIKTKMGFYFKANEFVQFIEKMKEIKLDSKTAIKEISESDIDQLATMPHARTLYDLEQLYGDGLEFRSHGESFLDLFQARFQPNGLYLLDEPEAPLSPINQLALISMMKDMLKQRAQFIIATHSPILMAFPEAEILLIENDEIIKVPYNELEHVTLTRDFLNNPESFLRHL